MEYVLITGASGGIGYELARQFAAAGYGLLLCASRESKLQEAGARLNGEFHVPVRLYVQDLSVLGAAKALYDRVNSDKLPVSVLVNNAGFGLAGALETLDYSRNEAMLLLNTVCLAQLCQLFLGDFYRRGGGKILNVASTGAFQPGPYTSTYFASKAFVLNFSGGIRVEAKKHGVQVCALCPGATRTDFFRREGTHAPRGAMSARTVAAYAFQRFMRGKGVSVPGWKNRVMQWFPVPLKVWAVARMKRNAHMDGT